MPSIFRPPLDPLSSADKLRRMRSSWRWFAITVFLAVFGGSVVLSQRQVTLPDDLKQALIRYAKVLHRTHDAYGAEVSYQELVEASINGMLRTLDPHTNFLPKEMYDDLRQRQQASFSGLGILIGMRNSQLTVVTPVEGTPAWKAGIRAGDVISAIEGETTSGMNLNEAVRQLKGPQGTTVNITIERRGLDESFDLAVTRDEIPQNTVAYSYMLDAKTGYIMLTDFSHSSTQEMLEAIDSLKGEGMENLVLDLRNNGGGLLDQAVEVSEIFVPAISKIVETRGRTPGSGQTYVADSSAVPADLPLVILVGPATASASEIVSGAVQDHDVGLIVGEATWGKGLVQTVYNISHGNGVALTTAKYYTPSGRLIQRDYSSWFDYTTRADGSYAANDNQASYSTDLGRTVLGGGGITPDYIVEPAEIPEFIGYLFVHNTFFNFGVEYQNRAPLSDQEWKEPSDLVGQFGDWLVEQEIVSPDELNQAYSDAQIQANILRRLRAEILGAAFGLGARSRELALSDPQVQEALARFPQASELLATRTALEDTGDDSDGQQSDQNIRG